MKLITLRILVVPCLLLLSRAATWAQGTIINWQGNGGYRAQITMIYDSSFLVLSAQGGGPFGGTPANQGISQLSVAFYSPLSLTPVYSTLDISNSVVTYKLLNISFNTVSRTLFGQLDVGRDSFAEGDPGSSAGQFYLTGVSSAALHDSFAAQVVDSGGQFVTVPEPSTWVLGAGGFVSAIAFRSWSRRNKSALNAASKFRL